MTNLILLLFIVTVLVSCESDKNPIGEQTHFVFDCDISNAEFISVTNQYGDIIFDTSGTNFKNLIHLDVPLTEKLTVTYGGESKFDFNLTTCRNVESGFKITNKSDCFIPFIPISNLKVEISGISDYSEFYYPLNGNKEIELNSIDNKLILRGIVEEKTDFLLTILPKGSNQYLSYLLKESNFIKLGKDNFTYSINITDFKPSTVHKIDLGINLSWIVRSSALQPNGQKVSLANWTNYLENQNGESVKLFSLNEINLSSLSLNIFNSFSYKGYEFNRLLNGFPDKLDAYNPTFEFLEVNSNKYNVLNNFEYDMSVIRYDYLKDNILSTWKIFDKKSETLSEELPKISSQILDKLKIFNELKEKPHACIAYFYKFNTPNFNNIYNASSIERSTQCYTFNNKSFGLQF